VNVTRQAKVSWVDNLVGAWIVQDRLGVDASLVREGAEARDGVVERCVDLNSLCNEIFQLLSHQYCRPPHLPQLYIPP